MSGEDIASLMKRRDRLRCGASKNLLTNAFKRPPSSGGFFIAPESRGQAVTQGGRVV
ncbi:MAG: hypothetical protein HQM09_01365 [Candidatus Riflebacteria bacterium]|nr:hypothetical protein [Candidatus Riflebacteria bacterium]